MNEGSRVRSPWVVLSIYLLFSLILLSPTPQHANELESPSNGAIRSLLRYAFIFARSCGASRTVAYHHGGQDHNHHHDVAGLCAGRGIELRPARRPNHAAAVSPHVLHQRNAWCWTLGRSTNLSGAFNYNFDQAWWAFAGRLTPATCSGIYGTTGSNVQCLSGFVTSLIGSPQIWNSSSAAFQAARASEVRDNHS